MALHEYRRGQAPGKSPEGDSLVKTRLAGAAITILVLVGLGIAADVKSRSLAVPTNPETLCPSKKAPSEVDVILLDVSDQFSEPQRLQIQSHLGRVRDAVPRFGLVELYTLDRLGRRVTEPLIHLCNPGTGSDLNSLYQNPDLARKRWEAFATKLSSVINGQISGPDLAISPIFEAVQATALRTFGAPEYDGIPKRLIIVSDLLQNVPGRLNMYDGVPSFEAFQRTPYFTRIRADLNGVSVLIYYLMRPDSHHQGRSHIAFWDQYFQSQGASVKSVDKVFGDK